MLPAYAGMIRPLDAGPLHGVGAPRVCGDDPGSSRSHGATPVVLPAYAGMILFAAHCASYVLSAPRVCGDDPKRRDVQDKQTLCSPRMRG